MSSDREPTRFSESAGAPELQQLFQSARQDLPSSSKLEGLWARIEPLAGPTSGTAPSPSPAAPSAGAGGAAAGKVLAIVAALGAAGVAAYFLTRPAPVAPQAPSAPRASTALQAPPSTAAAPSPATVSTVAPEAAETVEAAKPSNSSSVRAPAEGRGAAPPSKPISDASAEAALLERAREAIATDPKRALAITREHARRFPKGILAQEREVIAIDALKRLGKGSEAESRVDQFKKTYPGSAHQHGLDSATNQR